MYTNNHKQIFDVSCKVFSQSVLPLYRGGESERVLSAIEQEADRTISYSLYSHWVCMYLVKFSYIL